jgi:hypothetical protein
LQYTTALAGMAAKPRPKASTEVTNKRFIIHSRIPTSTPKAALQDTGLSLHLPSPNDRLEKSRSTTEARSEPWKPADPLVNSRQLAAALPVAVKFPYN